MAKVSNSVPQVINPTSESTLSVKLQFSPKDTLSALQMNLVDIAMNPDKINIKVSAILKVGVGIMKFTVPFDYTATLKQLMTKTPPSGDSHKC